MASWLRALVAMLPAGPEDRIVLLQSDEDLELVKDSEGEVDF